MTSDFFEPQPDPTISLLAQYLKGRSEVFQNKVYELVVNYGWDVNDPSFAILLATGQMETILESFPEQFESLFSRLMQESQQAFIQYQQWSESRQTELKEYIQGLEVQQCQSIAELNRNIGTFSDAVEAQRQSNFTAIDKIMAVAKERRAELLEELRTGLKPMQKEFTVSASSYARQLVSDSLTFWNKKAIREAALVGAILGFTFFGVGMLAGVRINQSFTDTFSDSAWAKLLWKWNESSYAACVKAHKTTCNFHVVPPKDK
jgi:hypothetical protein